MQALKLYFLMYMKASYGYIESIESRILFHNNQSHNFKQYFDSLSDLRIGYYSQEGSLYASPIITSSIQYSQTARSFSFYLRARSAYSCQGKFFIYFRVISLEFIAASLRKNCVFSHGF